MGREQTVQVTEDVEHELGVLESQGTREAISDCVGRGGNLDGDDCVWGGSGLEGALMDGNGRDLGCSDCTLMAGTPCCAWASSGRLICGNGRELWLCPCGPSIEMLIDGGAGLEDSSGKFTLGRGRELCTGVDGSSDATSIEGMTTDGTD